MNELKKSCSSTPTPTPTLNHNMLIDLLSFYPLIKEQMDQYRSNSQKKFSFSKSFLKLLKSDTTYNSDISFEISNYTFKLHKLIVISRGCIDLRYGCNLSKSSTLILLEWMYSGKISLEYTDDRIKTLFELIDVFKKKIRKDDVYNYIILLLSKEIENLNQQDIIHYFKMYRNKDESILFYIHGKKDKNNTAFIKIMESKIDEKNHKFENIISNHYKIESLFYDDFINDINKSIYMYNFDQYHTPIDIISIRCNFIYDNIKKLKLSDKEYKIILKYYYSYNTSFIEKDHDLSNLVNVYNFILNNKDKDLGYIKPFEDKLNELLLINSDKRKMVYSIIKQDMNKYSLIIDILMEYNK